MFINKRLSMLLYIQKVSKRFDGIKHKDRFVIIKKEANQRLKVLPAIILTFLLIYTSTACSCTFPSVARLNRGHFSRESFCYYLYKDKIFWKLHRFFSLFM